MADINHTGPVYGEQAGPFGFGFSRLPAIMRDVDGGDYIVAGSKT
jgi:hypothetical protein